MIRPAVKSHAPQPVSFTAWLDRRMAKDSLSGKVARGFAFADEDRVVRAVRHAERQYCNQTRQGYPPRMPSPAALTEYQFRLKQTTKENF